MIKLLPATQEAFSQRKLKLYPVLVVIDEAGVETTVSPSLIISRPARTHSPLLSKSPVMRLDLDIVPTEAMLALFKEQRRVCYTEIVNGQPIEKFSGHVWALDKGWTVKEGAVVTSLKVTAYSESQRLAGADCELYHTHRTLTAPAGKGLAFDPVLVTHYAYMVRQGAGNDPLPINAVWKPHSVGEDARATWVAANGDQFDRYGASDFAIVVGASGTLELQWLANAPAAGTAYQLVVKVPLSFVARFTDPTTPKTTFDLQTTPDQMAAYTLAADERTVEAIEEVNLAYCRYFTPSQSLPVVYTRAVGGGGAPVAAPMSDWELALERGYIRYIGKGAVFDTTQTKGGEVQFIGVTGLQWPDTVNHHNTPEMLFARLYEQAGAIGIADYYEGFEATGVVAAEFNGADKGDKLLGVVYGSLPPNYLVYDDESGLPRGRYLVQRAAAQLRLGTVTGLKDKEPPEMFTRLVVRSILADQPAAPWTLYTSFERTANVAGALVNDDTVWAYPAVNESWFRLAFPLDHSVRFKSLRIKFEGEVRVKVAPGDATVSWAWPDEAKAVYLAGYQVAQAATPTEITVGNLGGAVSTEAQVPSYLIVEFRPSPQVSTPKLYHLAMVVDQVLDRRAMLTDNVSTPSAWTADGAGYVRRVDTDFLKRWMVNENRSTDPSAFEREWWKHRNKVLEIPGISGTKAAALALAHMDDVLRRATAQEIDVVYEPMVQIGDTIELYDPTTRITHRRLVVGYREGTSWTEPITTLEVADYT